ncbi:MAG: hypothetical protein CVV25_11440 [Ignavibacteriae bacterium HGW-Ignavibacteriae-4]|jgi:hypothetical protein|nr:MAG: hypothetical protein CVV25_11440 [Ignavibacteriae bacterium HGW-Ignavibacteriae-4]
MKKLKDFLMLTCKKAATLIDKKAEVKLSWKENMQLTMHKSMCETCSAYEKQSKFMDKVLHRQIHADSEADLPIIKNKELQDKIISKCK